jgi:peptide chain release factor 2
MELSPTYQKIDELTQRSSALSAHLNLEEKQGRLEEVLLEMENPNIWSNPETAQALGKEKSTLESICQTFDNANAILEDAKELLDMAQSESDEETANSVIADLETIEISIARLEFQRMFNGKLDMNHAYLDIQSGSGGTEAQDWAEMVLRMYLRWGEKHNFKVKLMEASAGEVAGIKSATIHFEGEYAFGWLRSLPLNILWNSNRAIEISIVSKSAITLFAVSSSLSDCAISLFLYLFTIHELGTKPGDYTREIKLKFIHIHVPLFHTSNSLMKKS